MTTPNLDLDPLDGYQPLATHHCVTGSMRHIYLFHAHDISEDMLLGVGGGVGYIYWAQKGALPTMGGRRIDKVRGFEPVTAARTGVQVEAHRTTSAAKAERTLLEQLDAGQPVMLQVDMGFLPYFDFGGEEYHFGGHVVVAWGYDAANHTVLIADRDSELHPVPMAALAAARGSTHKPFPPKNCWWTWDFSQKRAPTGDEVRQAIHEQAHDMLHPPISNIGVAGIRKAAQMVLTWPRTMDPDRLRLALFNAYIFIDAVGGTGGGTFRYMFSRFLREGAAFTGGDRLLAVADDFQHIADQWQAVAAWFLNTSERSDAASVLPEVVRPLEDIADLEQAAWTRLEAITADAERVTQHS
ncbi:MAG: BtrH N-terminal domain-containing protein [Chloroflexi bacterium]|nr:BtrH N-terminal domain-containing protein [Chloroflexota bacterium]